MGNPPFLAMTAAEIRANPDFSAPIGWMACQFSPCGPGLSNLPDTLPAGSLLILNDQMPWCGHDAALITEQIKERIEALGCYGLLLDFQRPGIPEIQELVSLLCDGLSCPVGVTEAYFAGISCPVFLPPVPLHQTVTDYLSPWQGREIWLELALDAEEILLTPEGASTTPLLPWDAPKTTHHDDSLHCGYSVTLEETSARFTLSRTREDLAPLLEEAAKCGVTAAVGLWQELA